MLIWDDSVRSVRFGRPRVPPPLLLNLGGQKAPCSKDNLIRPKGPCGTRFRNKMQFYPPKRPLRDDFLTFEISTNMFPGIFFCFDICNLKLFAITNRLTIVPSLQNIQIIQFLMILRSNNKKSKKCRTTILPKRLPTRRLSGSKYNLILPKGPCGTIS